MDFLFHQIFFLLIFGLLLFLPGAVLLRTIFHKQGSFTLFEFVVFSAAISLGILDFTMILFGRLNVPFTAPTLLEALALFVVLCSGIFWYRQERISLLLSASETQEKKKYFASMDFTRYEGWLFILLFILTLLFKTVFLADAIVPTATDMGHHVYWSKLIAKTKELPLYAKQDVIETNGQYSVSDPQPIDDFIIGEHLPFAALAILSGMDFVSAFPGLVLFLINLLSILALFALTWRLFENKTIALLTLLFIGPLYALASPEAKFVSGGVVGNILGNFFISVLILAYFRALQEKSSLWLTLGFFLTFTLAYTHHLSTLVFLFIACGAVIVFLAFHWREAKQYMVQWFKLLLRPAPLIVAFLCILFFFFVLKPSYADPHSVDTALGSFSKESRAGLTLMQLSQSAGADRLGLGLLGLLLLLFYPFSLREKMPAGQMREQNNKVVIASEMHPHPSPLPLGEGVYYTRAFLIAWGGILLVMTLHPEWVLLDVPSNRISTYVTFPLAILAAVAVATLFDKMRNLHSTFSFNIAAVAFVILFAFILVSGFNDNSQSLSVRSRAEAMVQTFHASQYLTRHNQPDDLILKDHNYLVADAWMKLFFLRDYNYPLSRGLFSRYEDDGSRDEQCTLFMISIPNTPQGQKCYDETGVNLVVVNPHYDTVQFKKSKDFSLVYASDDVAVYLRNVK